MSHITVCGNCRAEMTIVHADRSGVVAMCTCDDPYPAPSLAEMIDTIVVGTGEELKVTDGLLGIEARLGEHLEVGHGPDSESAIRALWERVSSPEGEDAGD